MLIPTQHTPTELAAIALSLLLLGMSKGGFPVGAIALPLLVLVWPSQAGAAREAVGFLLPLLCLMDVIAILIYRRSIEWKRLRHVLPGAVAGVALASALFVSEHHALIAVSDRILKIAIGVVGLLFVAYFATRKWILAQLDDAAKPGWTIGSSFGVIAGITSSLAHAAGPLMQMYLLPQHLPKIRFAATMAGFFFVLNLVKMVPFALLGRIQTDSLMLGAMMLPVIPTGVVLGHLLVRITRQRHYVGFIYTVLFVTSIALIVKALA
ncbi:MAG: sulfite exporter TauE/SafE family protein [Verrucomicrobia bacterium]|jgi:uncharacterized protein|nr:sulfite exporter TauE/SafE family protein [Verrucomicrobiota bacterium]